MTKPAAFALTLLCCVALPGIAGPVASAAIAVHGGPAADSALWPGAPTAAAHAASPAAPPAPVQPPQQQPVPGDAVLQLLHDKGLLPKPATLASRLERIEASPFVRQVRDSASELVVSAMNFLGVRYRRGGDSAETGFDCSGFTRYVFERSVGLVLPHRADDQARRAGLADVAKEELRPGDLVFFNTMRKAFSHVGIYVGEGKFIHAPSSGKGVRIEDMGSAYWLKRFNGARRADIGSLAGSVALPSTQ